MTDNLRSRLQQLLTIADLPELGPGPRSGVRSEAELTKELEAMLREGNLPETSHELLRALVLLWHDHLDASHTISQGIENADGSLLHAIMHRREPDYWNSKYWWRRVGRHACFVELGTRVAAFLDSSSEHALAAKLAPSDLWDPFAFVDACEAATAKTDATRIKLLRQVQRIETEVVLEFFLRGA